MITAGSETRAAITDTLLNNVVNELQDVDYESQVVDVKQDGKVNDGDILLAILAVSEIHKGITGIDTSLNASTSDFTIFEPSSATRAFTGVSLIKVNGEPGVDGLVAQFVFTAPTAAEWLALTGITVSSDSVMAVLFDDPPGDPHVNHQAAPLSASVATATEGPMLWEFGFTGADGEFWKAETTAITGGDPTNIAQVKFLDFWAAVNVVNYNAGTPLGFHNALADPDLSGLLVGDFTAPTQLQLQGNKETGTAGIWQLKTDTNLYVYPIPEPVSIVTWLGLAGIGLVIGGRRRRND